MSSKLTIDDIEYLNKLRQKPTFPLHIHWDGSIPVEDIIKFAHIHDDVLLKPKTDWNNKEIEYPSIQKQRIWNSAQLKEIMNNLQSYWMPSVFDYAIRYMQTEKDIKNSAVALAKYLKSQNSPYAEVRFAPQYHTKKGLSTEEVIEHAVEGFFIAKDEVGVDMRLIVSIARERPLEESVSVVEAALNCNSKYPEHVLGIDLACKETPEYNPGRYYDVFKLTFDSSLKRTVHAGEMCDEETNLKHIEESIEVLKADALSHAIPLYKSPKLINKVLDKKIRIESNPVCNARFFIDKIEDLHLDVLFNKGLLVSLNSDDPAMIPNGDLVHNLYHVGKVYGNKFVDVAIKNSINSSWGLDQKQKNKYLTLLDNV